MPDTNVPPPILPAHIEETIRSTARLQVEHHGNATLLQRAVNRVTALLGDPRFIGGLTITVVGWISLNLLTPALGFRAVDPPTFPWLGGAISLISLYMVVLILGAQRHADSLARYREMLERPALRLTRGGFPNRLNFDSRLELARRPA